MLKEAIELSARAIEVLAVAIILFAVVHATLRYLFHLTTSPADAYERFKVYIGKAMLLGLEFLVAADVVETVALERTPESVGILAVLVLVRTFLSWSLVVEIEGRWPWRAGAAEERP